MYRLYVHSQICQDQLIEKKIRSITFLVWVLGRVKKMPKKVKKCKKYFFGLKPISN